MAMLLSTNLQFASACGGNEAATEGGQVGGRGLMDRASSAQKFRIMAEALGSGPRLSNEAVHSFASF